MITDAGDSRDVDNLVLSIYLSYYRAIFQP